MDDRSFLSRLPRSPGPGVRLLLALALGAGLPSCGFVAYDVARSEVDSPIEIERYGLLRVGHTRFAEAIAVLGPPSRIQTGWDEAGDPFTRVDYYYGKSRGSDLSVKVPLKEIIAYNSGIRFLVLFFRAMRGESVVPSEVQPLIPQTAANSTAVPNSIRLSNRDEACGGLRGRGTRLSELGGEAYAAVSGDDGMLLAFDPLTLQDTSRGVDRVRLEFDDAGILVRKEERRATPRTDVGAQVRDSLLQ
jgi:hypothetical protein